MGSPDEVLTPWLEGKPLADFDGDAEQELRRELAQLQGYVADLERRHTASLQSAMRVNDMLKRWADEAERESCCFGEYPGPSALWRGYLCGRGEMARTYGRQFQFLANLLRARSMADERGAE